MSARCFACLITLNLVALSDGQSLEVGVITGSLGQGISLSTDVSENWTFHIRGSYQTRSTARPYASGGLRFASTDRTVSGAVSISVDRHLPKLFGISAGLCVLAAERTLALEPVSGMLAGTELTPEELGSVSVRVSLPQHPMPYLGAYKTARLFRRWAARVDLGVLYTGRSSTESEASGRLSPTASWLRETQSGVSPSRLIPVIQLGLSLELDAPTR
ncbi:MAG: hypothetical protein ACI9W4_001229 [Rhodothermales bacterium]|jgi:hypothetical protein